jgi:competence protein ComEA
MHIFRTLFLALLLTLGLTSTAIADDHSVNINTSTAEELAELPGIGEKKAAAIIQHLEAHGYFNSVDDLAAIKGIGQKTVDGFRDQVELDVPLDHELKKKGYK